MGILRLLDSTCSLGHAARDGEALVSSFNASHVHNGAEGNKGAKSVQRRSSSIMQFDSDKHATSPPRQRRASIGALPADSDQGSKATGDSYRMCGPSTSWRKRNGSRTTDHDFVVMHFAGPVIYTVQDWVPRNRDELHSHISELLSSCAIVTSSQTTSNSSSHDRSIKVPTNFLIRDLFPPNSGEGATSPINSPTKNHAGGGAQTHAKVTVGGKFLTQLANLRMMLTSGDARFVRCVKTNNQHLPRSVDRSSVLRQLVSLHPLNFHQKKLCEASNPGVSTGVWWSDGGS